MSKFDETSLNANNTPVRWRRVGKYLVDNDADQLNKLEPTYRAILQKAATFTSDEQLGVGDQEDLSPLYVEDINVSGFTTAIDANVPETVQLSAEVLPTDADDTSVTWSSSDETVATVDNTGLVTAVDAGSAQIRATANDGSGTYGYETVEVINPDV